MSKWIVAGLLWLATRSALVGLGASDTVGLYAGLAVGALGYIATSAWLEWVDERRRWQAAFRAALDRERLPWEPTPEESIAQGWGIAGSSDAGVGMPDDQEEPVAVTVYGHLKHHPPSYYRLHPERDQGFGVPQQEINEILSSRQAAAAKDGRVRSLSYRDAHPEEFEAEAWQELKH